MVGKYKIGALIKHKYTNSIYKIVDNCVGLYELHDQTNNKYVFINLISIFKDFKSASKAEVVLYGR